MSFFKQFFILAVICFATLSGCAAAEKGNVPADFVLVIDVRNEEIANENLNVNIRIQANGKGQFEYYDPRGVIHYDPAGMVVYDADQIVRTGKFQLTENELNQLWDILNENNFFELEDAYQMAIGYSYAFIMAEANGQRHQVNNIGMEVSEIRAIVEGTEEVLPAEIDFEYGEGFKP